MKMHRLLRRQLDAQFGSHADAPSGLARLFRDIDAEYRRADQDREALSRALALIGDLAQRHAVGTEETKGGARRPAFSRALRRLFEQAPFAVVICDSSMQVTSWNAGAHDEPASRRAGGAGPARRGQPPLRGQRAGEPVRSRVPARPPLTAASATSSL